MPTRLCNSCGREKTIRGVWYLTPARMEPSPFECESCYRSEREATLLPPGLLG